MTRGCAPHLAVRFKATTAAVAAQRVGSVMSDACVDCGLSIVGNGSRNWSTRCRACHVQSIGGDTPLRVWARDCGVGIRQIAEETGVAYRTVQRAASGHRVSVDAAKLLAARTGLDLLTFLEGVEGV